MSTRLYLPLKPDTAYRSFDLLLPKERIDPESVKRALTFFPISGEVKIIEAWHESETHLWVPREFFSAQELIDADIPITNLESLVSYETITVEHHITLRNDIQEQAAKAMASRDGTIVLACGKGKTVVDLYSALQWAFPTMIVVTKSQHMTQWINEIEKFTDLSRDQIGVISGKNTLNEEELEKPIVVAMIHTLAFNLRHLPMRYRLRFGIIIYDEAHHVSANVFSRAANIFIGRRWASTATDKRSDGLEQVYQGHLGPVLYKNLEQDVPIRVYFIRTGKVIRNFEPFQNTRGVLSTAKLRESLAEDEERNNLILRDILTAYKAGRTILICTPTRDHAELLYKKLVDFEVDVKLTYGVTGKKATEKRQKDIEVGKVLVSTHELGYEGLNKPELDTIFVAFPYKDPNFWQQLLGRAQRQALGKKDAICVVYEDTDVKPIYSTIRKSKAAINNLGHEIITKGNQETDGITNNRLKEIAEGTSFNGGKNSRQSLVHF